MGKSKQGRPKLPQNLHRVRVNVLIDAVTAAWLKSQPRGRGHAIDKLVRKAMSEEVEQ